MLKAFSVIDSTNPDGATPPAVIGAVDVDTPSLRDAAALPQAKGTKHLDRYVTGLSTPSACIEPEDARLTMDLFNESTCNARGRPADPNASDRAKARRKARSPLPPT